MIISFDLQAGLNELLPGARYKGVFERNDEVEYNLLEWYDVREKPLYQVVESKSLTIMRCRARDAINRKTDELIINGFIYRGVRFSCHLEEQFNMLVILMFAEKGLIQYPYKFKCSDTNEGEGVYIDFIDAVDITNCFISGFAYVAGIIASGRLLKDPLGSINRTELEELRDTR